MTKIMAICTCFNRKEKTLNCIRSLCIGNPELDISFVICDDNSKDGTYEALQTMENVTVIHGSGSLFYTGGMRKAIAYVLDNELKSDYILFINDDVSFFDRAIEKLVEQQRNSKSDVIVGCTSGEKDELTYGGVTYPNGSLKYKKHGPGSDVVCDTFHANCVLIKYEIFKKTGNMDGVYRHSLGDFDYGLVISKNGHTINVSEDYVGRCIIDKKEGTYRDQELTRWQRIKDKESPKGVPTKEWFYFVYKNFGLVPAIIHSVGPYLKILLGK